MYLFRDKCVKSCPDGTYPDKLTGWCAKCDCNCGTGGCIDRFTCKSCPMTGMSIDKETGKCKCDTTVTGAWANDWKSFTITIDSTDVKFRDLNAEKSMSTTNMMKTCRIGNEGSIFDNKDAAVKKEDVTVNRCGDSTNTDTALEDMKKEFENIEHEDKSASDEVPDSTSTNGAPDQSTKSSGPSMGGMQGGTTSKLPGGGSSTSTTTGSTTPSTTTTTTTTSPQYNVVSNTSGQCPALKEKMNNDELSQAGIDSLSNDFYKYVKEIGASFGDISDQDLQMNESPLTGLKFTSEPTDLCGILFDADTLEKTFKKPTCTMIQANSKTVITVMVGEYAPIHPDFSLKVQPNVFLEGCDWPVLNVLKLTDGSDPESLKVRLVEVANTAITCENLSMTLNTEGNVGEVDCDLKIDEVKTSAGAAVTTSTATTVVKDISTENTKLGSSGELKITKEQLAKLKAENVEKIKIKGECTDSYGQKLMVSKEVTLSDGASEVKMKNQQDTIVYDPSKSYPLVLNFDYKNCGSTTSTVTYTSKLQKMSGSSWIDTTEAAEMITNNLIPKGLSTTTKYRVAITATTTEGTTKDFTLNISFLEKKPEVKVDDVPQYIKTDEALTHTFTLDQFTNVDALSDVTLSFTCTKCSGGKCLKADGSEFDMNSYYTASTHTINVPAGTFPQNTCYSIVLTAASKGNTASKTITLKTADSSVKQSLDIDFNFSQDKFIDVSRPGHLKCRPKDNKLKDSDYTVTSTLIDASGNAPGDCAASSGKEVSYTADCLSTGTTYTMSCEITLTNDATTKGVESRSFSTTMAYEVSATISPSSGTQLTQFQVEVTSTHTESIECGLGIVDPKNKDGFTLIGDTFTVAGSGTTTLTEIMLKPTAGSTSSQLKVDCEAKSDKSKSYTSLSVTVSAYSGTDLATQEEALTSELVTTLETIDLTTGDADVIAEKADNALSSANMMSGLMANFSPEKSRKTAKNLLNVIKKCKIDFTDSKSYKKVVSGVSTFGTVAKNGGTDGEGVAAFADVVVSLLGDYTTATARNLQTTTATDTVKGINPKKGSDSVVQLDQNDFQMLMNALSQVSEGLSNNKDQLTELEYQKANKVLMVSSDKIIKSVLSSISDNSNIELPFKQFHLIVERLTVDATNLAQEYEYAYTCPCNSGYKPTTVSTDPEATSGTIDINGEKTQATKTSKPKGTAMNSDGTTYDASEGKLKRATQTGQCKVSRPSLSAISSSITNCASVGVVVMTTKSMCPNSQISATDSSKFKTPTADETADALTSVSSTSTDKYSQTFSSSSSSCQTSSYSKMGCNGPSIEVSFYCLESTNTDANSKLSIERLSITKFEDDQEIEYSMNCGDSTTTYDSSQTETPVFLSEDTGENSCYGCESTTSGTIKCQHATSFGYATSTGSIATSPTGQGSSSSEDWWERIYADYVLYLMIALDLYFIIACIFGFIKREKKHTIQIADVSRAVPDEGGKPSRLDMTNSMDRRSQESKKSDEEVPHKTRFCKKLSLGWLLKYRLITPFTTEHSKYSRISRAAVNVIVLYLIWVFSGIIHNGINETAGSYCTSIVVCFIVARLSTFLLELLHRKRHNKIITATTYAVDFVLVAVLHVSIFLITENMGDEFGMWGYIVLITFLIDLIIWEVFSLCIQLCIASKLANDLDSFSGKRKFMEKLVTPPLLQKFLDP